MELLVIGIAIALCYAAYRFYRGIKIRRVFESVFINGKKTSLNKLMIEIGLDAGVSPKSLAQLSPFFFNASPQIRTRLRESNNSYQAIIAYSMAEMFEILSSTALDGGDTGRFVDFSFNSKRCAVYAASFCKEDFSSLPSWIEEIMEEVSDELKISPNLLNQFLQSLQSEDLEFLKSKSDQGESLGGWVCLYIANYFANGLETGQHHVYRGLLSEQGEEMWRIFKTATNAALNEEVLDAKTAEKNINSVETNISEVG